MATESGERRLRACSFRQLAEKHLVRPVERKVLVPAKLPATAGNRHSGSEQPALPRERSSVLSKRLSTADRVLVDAVVLASFLWIQIASAGWQVVSAEREASSVAGIEHRHIVLQNSAEENATIDLVEFSSKSATLHLIDNPDGSENLSDAMKRGNLVAGVNGGYFDTEFKPLGLRIVEGTTRSRLTRARLLTGVVCASPHEIEIVRLGEFSRKKKCDGALECGPFLIDRGTPVLGLDQTRDARRTFVALARGGAATLGVSTELSLAELASALAALPDFKIARALNLDGGSSSAFWFRKKDGSIFSIPEEKAVRDFVGIVPHHPSSRAPVEGSR